MNTVSTAGQQADIPDLFVAKEHKQALDLKGSIFTLTVLRLHSNDFPAIESELKARIAQGPRFFEDAPVVIDIEALKEENLEIDFGQIANLMRELRLVPVGVRHGTTMQQEQARSAGLALMKGGAIRDLPAMQTTPSKAEPKRDEGQETNRDGKKNAEVSGSTGQHHVAKPKDETSGEGAQTGTTRYVYQPIRSGQQIYARGGDLIVLAAVNAGAEIVADGNIHVYAPLRGRALAGVGGDTKARIFCHQMEAELVSLAGHYRVFEDNVPDGLRGKAVQIYLDEKEQLKIELMGT